MAKMIETQIEIVVEHKCVLGEGPVWDAKQKLICWIDIVKGEIHEFSPIEKTHKITEVHQMVGSIAVCTNENFIAGLQNGFAFIDRKTGKVSMITNPEAHLPDNRFNDGKCDPEGRFFAGTMSSTEEPGAGSLYVLENDLSVSKKTEGVTVSNGLAWSGDDKIFYYIDTPTRKVCAYDYDKKTGGIKNRKIAIDVPEEDGHPDGMTIDCEGMLWIAHWDGGQVTRWNPATGKKLHHIKVPAAHVTSCTFGGEHLDELYITTASRGATDEQLQKLPLSGSLFVVRNTGFKGVPAFEFKA